MRTVQMTLDEELISIVDKISKKLGTTRSGFTRAALRRAVEKIERNKLEKQHFEGYKRAPVKRGEFSLWESEQAWID